MTLYETEIFLSGESETVRKLTGDIIPLVGDHVFLANHGSLKVLKREFREMSRSFVLVYLYVENPYRTDDNGT